MAKKKQFSVEKIHKPTQRLNALFDEVMDNISYGSNRSDSSRQRELQRMTNVIDDVLSDEINNMTDFTGDDISTFLVKLFNDYDSNNGQEIKSVESLFESENSGLFELFNQRYKNRSLLFEDLQTVSAHLFELGEAINTTRDAILTSDDVSCIISRGIKFGESDDSNYQSYTKEVEKLERRFGLHQKIKEHITPNTLRYGSYYVYTIPYAQLFKSYHEKKTSSIRTATTESFTPAEVDEIKKGFDIKSHSSIVSTLNEFTSNIEICNDHEALPLIEGLDVSVLFDNDKFKKMRNKTIKQAEKNQSSLYADAVKDTESEFDGIRDCYIEYLDPRKVIPVKVLNKIIGYYYIHESVTEPTTNTFTNTFKFNTNKEVDYTKIENQFIGKLADKVTKSFDKQFIENNIKFKELIANALIYNDIYRKKVRFQFIPAEYITEFAVNLDIDGEGTSILYPSLFYAKLYLGLLVFKIMSILSKSNDTRITYIKNSGVDKDISSQIQSVARSLKQRQINFNDLISSNSVGMINKIGAAKDIFMPVGKSGERAIDFDTLAGQDVQLNTELMEMLRSAYISATGVPSVIMNYVNEADYAKTLVMANSKFVGRVVSYQHDLNDSITKLYQKIMKYCTTIPEEIIDSFTFTLSAPKSLNTMNLTDLIANADQVAAQVIKTLTGENADQTEDDNKLKDFMYNKIIRDLLPMIQWDRMDMYKREAELELAQNKVNKAAKSEEDSM